MRTAAAALLGAFVAAGACPAQTLPEVPASAASAALASAAASAPDAAAPAACPVQVYRMSTSYHRANPELPYVFANDQKVSRLGVGKTVCVKLAPGRHTISMREAFVFMPGPESGRLEIDVAAGQTVYVRYAKEFGGVVPTGQGAAMTSQSNLRLATEEEWKSRR